MTIAFIKNGLIFLGSLVLPIADINNKEENNIKQEKRSSVESASINLDFTKPIHTMRGGIGASWHAIDKPAPLPLYVNGRGGNPPLENKDAWAQLYKHASWLGMDWMRVEFTQVMYEPERGKYDWENREMQNLYRILDWCEKNKADVFLQQMRNDVAWNAFPEWQNDSVKVAASGPHSVDEFAEGLAELVEHLVKEKKYTCIKWLNITNEPPFWWKQPSGKPLSITPSLEAVKKALAKRKLNVLLTAPDTVPVTEVNADNIDYDHLIGAYDLHEYFAYFDWRQGNPPVQGNPVPMSVFQRRLGDWARFAHKKGKPFFLSELGTHHYGTDIKNPGPAVFEAALHNAELVVRGLNTGTDAFSRWSFVNRGETGAQWQIVDTYDTETKTFRDKITPHPNVYYFYGLLTRFIAKNSTVFESTVDGGTDGKYQRLFTTAVKSPKGQTTIAVVNDGDNDIDITVMISSKSGLKNMYRYAVSKRDADRTDLNMDPKENIDIHAGKITSKIPAKSLSIFTTYNLKNSDDGITVE